MLALGVVCADSDAEAERLLLSARLFRRRIRQGDVRPIPTVEDRLPDAAPSSCKSQVLVGNPEPPL